MSENKPENTGKPGSPSSPSATPASSTPLRPSTSSGATPGASKPDVLPPEPAASLPLSHEDSIQSPIKDVVAPSAALPAAGEAAARSSTDDADSASTVTPTDAQTARQRDAAEARSSAAASTAQQEAEVHERAARKAGQAYKSPATPPGTLESSEPLTGELSAPADEAALTGNEEKAQEAAAAARRAGSPPPGFGAAPDFTATNPPPPNALPPSPPRYLRQSDSAWTVFGRIIAARARQLFDRAGQRITQRTLRIGVSARIFHPEPGAKGLRGKTLQYLEESIAHWVMSRDVLVFMIPTVGHQGMLHPSNIRLRDYAKHLDGLLLQGGADVSPQSYAEQATSPEWPGDRVRDMYELELLHEFIESGKPVLGVCRGCQLINVAFGGTLYQDIATEVPTAGTHVNEHYDQHRHGIHFPDGSTLANMFPGRREAIVNSIHHQAVKTIGRDLNIEAVSASDGIIEAVRYRRAPFVMGVQWHPEFHRAGGPELLDCTPLLDTFLRVARETRF
ncbi:MULTISPECIES: gamma-glutamyl-gamma-aminobutyrate hydrolase family protein [Paraburkholderia]|uniref:Gamma-glutamyl-gamma-aminobutyrate hydrolase family protein n=1 Tax=Paraburkholderia madseniana TaxID=2599607 RepID=A0AAP5ET33_9BURK|nr:MULTISPECIES: gamma-glutamyl-gamma-aminobutyrate hydrolase family protein [Paraburkholderia]MCX4150829.1 gamma-glutamyl-gamma-aminobutyrate hydrolase family protein [Paraburkholderia madseniana]MDN7153762.1 gamma-glutamyl-gamma-aminobutyrate hydrolase family protein [Paraburkholderia sp. WS6]MDQ6412644.1 gamma-glutamyl-gamma-aminobutyrate hydrolase family protein [Paraburkholderia madseniana]